MKKTVQYDPSDEVIEIRHEREEERKFKGHEEEGETETNAEENEMRGKSEGGWSRDYTSAEYGFDCPADSEEFLPYNQKQRKLTVIWTHPPIKTFPSIREPKGINETPEQRALRRLRSRLQPFVDHPCYHSAVSQTDKQLLAWLVTFDLNVFVVEAKLKRHCEMRRKFGLDTILTDYRAPDTLKQHYTGGLCGVDREGRPVWYELLGKLDMNSLVKCLVREDLIRHKFYQLEMLKKKANESGFTQILVVVDMKGMPIKVLGPALEIWREYIDIVQDHYPYLVHEFIIIHPPHIFTAFTLGLRPYLNRMTRSKVTVLGHNYFKFLNERIEKHEIPAYLGGYRCDIDNNPWCKDDLTWNGVVPRWMFTYPHISANVHELAIPGGQRLVKETHVTTPGCHVYWAFYKMNQPIILSVYLNRIADDSCVIKEQRMTTDISTSGHVAGIVCEGAGRFLTVMDNCKNFSSPAKGLYKIVVHPPEWLEAHLAEKKPLGDFFDMYCFMHEEERKYVRWKFFKEPHYTWRPEFPPITQT